MSANELAANGMTGNTQPAWKQELNDKIAAARARRLSSQPPADHTTKTFGQGNSRTSQVAAAVAARYADAPSYSEYLASEVRAAMMAAVAAQAAANQSRAAATGSPDAAVTSEVEAMALSAPPASAPAPVVSSPAEPDRAPRVRPSKTPQAPRVDHAASGFPYATPARPPVTHTNRPASQPAPEPRGYVPTAPFLSDPFAEALITPATPLPAKLLEFPRELVAARKARPRHAEGPLRDGILEETGQLRIFEVEPSAISTKAEPVPQATEWSSIRLDAYPAAYTDFVDHGGGSRTVSDPGLKTAMDTGVTSTQEAALHDPAYNQRVAHAQSQLGTHPAGSLHSRAPNRALQLAILPQVAGLADRLMAGIVDAALVGIAFVLFVLIFGVSTPHPLGGKPALIGGAIVFTALYLLYQLLFFTYADGTPGMRYARIALCTFDDDNPTRDAMRKRIFALVLAAAPLGLGFLYALFDEDNLGWHDRMTRMYQRSYK